jgi:hypothetical protein
LVPSTFDICWNCGANRTGNQQVDLESQMDRDAGPGPDVDDERKLPLAGREDQSSEVVAAEVVRLTCPRCRSDNVLYDVPVSGWGGAAGQQWQLVLQSEIPASPGQAPATLKLQATICGDCGHVEFRAVDPASLYQWYSGRGRDL